MRFPLEVLAYLDALVEQRRAKDRAEGRERSVHRADILADLLQRARVPSGPTAIHDKRLHETYQAAFGDRP